MAKTFKAVTLTISIERDARQVYDFVSDLGNLPKWAKTFCRGIKKTGGKWMIETPQGVMGMRIAVRNQFGVLDHYVLPPHGGEVFVPMRVVASGPGSEVLFTLFHRPEMSSEQFFSDRALVEQDLKTLKEIMER